MQSSNLISRKESSESENDAVRVVTVNQTK